MAWTARYLTDIIIQLILCHFAPSALAAPMARVIAVTALAALRSSGAPFHAQGPCLRLLATVRNTPGALYPRPFGRGYPASALTPTSSTLTELSVWSSWAASCGARELSARIMIGQVVRMKGEHGDVPALPSTSPRVTYGRRPTAIGNSGPAGGTAATGDGARNG
jgi:hypothetical protein